MRFTASSAIGEWAAPRIGSDIRRLEGHCLA
jgi:hypothetical protein